jgi:hypothetical protein
MKRILSVLSLVGVAQAGATLGAASAADAPVPVSVPTPEKQFLITRQEADSRFVTSIE